MRALLLAATLIAAPAAAQPAPPGEPSGALLEADRGFAAEIMASGALAAYAVTLAPEGVLFDATGPSPAGEAGAAARFGTMPAGAQMRRLPDGANLSTDGRTGASWGGYELRDGERVVATGRYLTSWRVDDQGYWRIVAELAAGRAVARSTPPAASAPATTPPRLTLPPRTDPTAPILTGPGGAPPRN